MSVWLEPTFDEPLVRRTEDMKRIKRLIIGCLGGVALALASLPVQAAPMADPTYTAMRAAKPDGRTLVVSQPFSLERDAFTFEFERGAFHFLSPVEGRTWGAVFVGEGKFRLRPATEDEREHLAFLRGEPALEQVEDRFERLVLMFADDTFEELSLQGQVSPGGPDGAANDAYRAAVSRQRDDLKVNLHLRVLQDLLDAPSFKGGVFLATFDGSALPPMLAAVDPRGLDGLLRGGLLGGEDTALIAVSDVRGGLWYACDRVGEVKSGRVPSPRSVADAQHYVVDTEIRSNEALAGTTVIRFKAAAPLRVVPVELASTLRVSEASWRPSGTESWQPVAVVQEEEKKDADVGLVLPEILVKGAEAEVRLSYEGKEVLFELGFDVYAVGARTSWYPNLGIFSDTATFDLTYRVPENNDVVSVGQLVASRKEGKKLVSEWRALLPIRVAGFNYGRFKRFPQRDDVSGLSINVFANEKGIQIYGRSTRSEIAEAIVNPGEIDVVDVSGSFGPSTGRGNAKNAAENVGVDAINAARLFHTYFGALPQSEVSITQQSSFNFGQSWPSLIFLPYQSFLSSTARNALDLNAFGGDDFTEQVGFHELAHQWWGHHLGWQSYRDQWLSEGFAEFSAKLALQYTQGWPAYIDDWKRSRDRMLSPVGNTVPAYQVGPISRGLRLATAKSRAAYGVLTYSKGAFVLHMLRMLMFEPAAPTPDARFIAMMKDFTSTYAGQAPSTADFQKTVERHMFGPMNATGDGKMNWFFQQWVYGTEMPRLTSSLKAEKAANGEYRLTGWVEMSEVSPDFKALVPLYVDFGKDRLAQVGRLPFAGPGKKNVDVTVKLPEKPKRVLVNAKWEVLARD